MENNGNNVTEVTKPTGNEIAMEILKHEQDKSKAKNVGVIGMALGMVALAAATVAITVHLTNVNYQNDCEWRELFSSYEFITQDGEGQNYYNSDIGGNVNNGTANNETEK